MESSLTKRAKQFVISHSALGLAVCTFIIVFFCWRFGGGATLFFRAQYERDRLKWKAWVDVMCTTEILEANAHNDNMILQITQNCNRYAAIVNHSTDQYILDNWLYVFLYYANLFFHLALYHYVLTAVFTSLGGIVLYFASPWIPWRWWAKKKVE